MGTTNSHVVLETLRGVNSTSKGRFALAELDATCFGASHPLVLENNQRSEHSWRTPEGQSQTGRGMQLL